MRLTKKNIIYNCLFYLFLFFIYLAFILVFGNITGENYEYIFEGSNYIFVTGKDLSNNSFINFYYVFFILYLVVYLLSLVIFYLKRNFFKKIYIINMIFLAILILYQFFYVIKLNNTLLIGQEIFIIDLLEYTLFKSGYIINPFSIFIVYNATVLIYLFKVIKANYNL